MSANSAAVPVNHHDSDDYDPETPPSSGRPYCRNYLELSIICERLNLFEPPETTSDRAQSEVKDVKDYRCLQCSISFRTAETLLEHRRTSALHITCKSCEIAEDFADLAELRQHCCDHHFGCPYCEGATVCKTAVALDRHYRIDHFSCRFCIFLHLFATKDDLQAHYRASHLACPRCPKPVVFLYKEELREHCLDQHFGCPCCNAVPWSENEEQLNTHFRQEHFPCCSCNDQTVFTLQEDLLAHQRTAHGVFDCHFCYPQQPRIIWPAPWRKHMEQCYYPNPCTDDFHSATAHTIDYCDLCEETFLPQNREFHLLWWHFCQDCARYGTIFKMHHDGHASECSRHGPRWSKKEYDESRSTRANGRDQWQRRTQQDDLPGDYFWRGFENFKTSKTRANEHKAPPPPPSSPPPPPTRRPQEPAPLDIYTILNISPRSSPYEMKRAVRDRRIETHPDKRKRQGLAKEEGDELEEEAKLVGWAADILLDSEKRQEHDEQMHAWKVRFRQWRFGSEGTMAFY